ncbi:MAG: DUF222 domain-containing protein [Geodermatophilaceae bacterium]
MALLAQADALLLAHLAEADARGLARARGATSMTAWLRGSHQLAASEASRLVRTARALRDQLQATAQAMTAGTVHLCQAEVIVDSLKDLSAEVGPEQRAGGGSHPDRRVRHPGPGRARSARPPPGGAARPRRGAGPRRGQDPGPRAARVRQTRVHPEPGPVRVSELSSP